MVATGAERMEPAGVTVSDLAVLTVGASVALAFPREMGIGWLFSGSTGKISRRGSGRSD
jgi:hypothetical protein